MGKRSGVLDHEADFLGAPLSVLDKELARCEVMRGVATSARNRKSLENRIYWLTKLQARHPDAGEG